jgi:hypothetical protein
MNTAMNFANGYENVKVSACSSRWCAEEVVDFINKEAASCKMEFLESNIDYMEEGDEFYDDEVDFIFFSTDKRKWMRVTIDKEDGNYDFWTEMGKNEVEIEGFAISETGGTYDKVLRVEKIKVGN